MADIKEWASDHKVELAGAAGAALLILFVVTRRKRTPAAQGPALYLTPDVLASTGAGEVLTITGGGSPPASGGAGGTLIGLSPKPTATTSPVVPQLHPSGVYGSTTVYSAFNTTLPVPLPKPLSPITGAAIGYSVYGKPLTGQLSPLQAQTVLRQNPTLVSLLAPTGATGMTLVSLVNKIANEGMPLSDAVNLYRTGYHV